MSKSWTQLGWNEQVLGPLPEEWDVGPLDKVLTSIDAGRSPDLPDRPAQAGEWGVLKVSAIRSSGLQETENKAVIRPSLIDPSVEVKNGDLLVSRANTPVLVGLACYVREPRSGLMLSDKTLRLNIDSKLALPKFVSYLLQAPFSRRQIEVNGTGSSGSMKNISQDEIRSLVLPLPGIQEQYRLTEILDTADKVIRATEQLIAKLEHTKQGLLHDLLTLGIDEDHRFRDADLHPEKFKLTSPGRIPATWDVVSVGNIGDVLLGRQRSPQQQKGRFLLPYLRVANVFDGFIDYSDVLRMNFTPREQEIYGLRSGDLLLNEGQSLELVGRCAIYEDRPDLHCFQNTLVRYRCSESIIPAFAYLTFKYWLALGRFMRVAKKTTSMAHLGASRFAAMPIVVPSLTEQQNIVAAFDSFEHRIATERDQLAKQKLVKQGVMDDSADRAGAGRSLSVSAGPEYSRVELPLVQQLKGLGWSHVEGSKSDPGMTGRGSFREVFLEGRLRDCAEADQPRSRLASPGWMRGGFRRRLERCCGRRRSGWLRSIRSLPSGCCWARRWTGLRGGITGGIGLFSSLTGSIRSGTTSWW